MRTVASWICVGLVIATAACSTSGGTKPTQADVNAATSGVESAITTYLSGGEGNLPSSAQDTAGWQTWEAGVGQRLSKVQTAFSTWSGILDRAGNSVPANVLAARDGFKTWITDQEEQSRLAKGCIALLPNQQMSASCFTNMVGTNGPRWNVDAAALNKLLNIGKP